MIEYEEKVMQPSDLKASQVRNGTSYCLLNVGDMVLQSWVFFALFHFVLKYWGLNLGPYAY
jgi:hypothetical protein